MGATAASERRHGRLVKSALLCAVILGILGMHALSQHCTMTAGEATTSGHHSGASASASAMGTGMGTGMAMAVEVVATGTDVVSPSGGGPGAGSAMICAFIVLVGASALLLARLRRLPTRASHAVRRVRGTWRRRVVLATGAGPPYLWDNSVVRC